MQRTRLTSDTVDQDSLIYDYLALHGEHAKKNWMLSEPRIEAETSSLLNFYLIIVLEIIMDFLACCFDNQILVSIANASI